MLLGMNNIAYSTFFKYVEIGVFFMTDFREKFTNEFASKLLSNFSPDNVKDIISLLVLTLDKYEITERTTSLSIRDNTSEKLLELYAGSLLTEGRSKKTVYGYIKFLKRFLADMEKPFTEIATFDVRVWLAKMQKEISLRTCENYRSYLSAFYIWMEKEEIITRNPMNKISPIKFTQEVKTPFSDVEIDTIRMNCKNKRDRAIIELLLSSGIRVSELAHLKINDVDFVNKSILIREAKGGKQRVVYITDICLTHLKEYIKSRNDNYDCLFITRNKTAMTKDSIENSLRKLGKISGVENVHPHRFRRTFATNLYKRGMDIRSIQKLMGHTNIDTTTIYVNTNQDIINAEYRRYA